MLTLLVELDEEALDRNNIERAVVNDKDLRLLTLWIFVRQLILFREVQIFGSSLFRIEWHVFSTVTSDKQTRLLKV